MRLDEARKKHKLTQTALGEAVGVSQRAISSYEAGARKPSPIVAMKIAHVLGLTVAEMWEMLYADSGDKSRGETDGKTTIC